VKLVAPEKVLLPLNVLFPMRVLSPCLTNFGMIAFLFTFLIIERT
jgi:hypothetical protein